MDLYKNAACNELRRLLKIFESMQVSPSTPMQDMAKMRGRIKRLVDALDLIERQEKFSGGER